MSAPSHSSSSRAEALLREAIAVGADALFIKRRGERVTVTFAVDGERPQELERVEDDLEGLLNEFKSLVTEMAFDDEYGWAGQFAFSEAGQQVWVQPGWIHFGFRKPQGIAILGHRPSFSELGLSSSHAATLENLMLFPQGLIIGCGEPGRGLSTTLDALAERLAQKGKRVAKLCGGSDPRLQGITQIETASDEWATQAQNLAGQFDVIALETLTKRSREVEFGTPQRIRIAFDLAARGHLVLGLMNTQPLTLVLDQMLESGIAPDDIRTHFLGGWSQILVRRANGRGRAGLFNCMNRDEARQQVLEPDDLHRRIFSAEERRVLWRDAEEKIAEGLITREEAARVIQNS